MLASFAAATLSMPAAGVAQGQAPAARQGGELAGGQRRGAQVSFTAVGKVFRFVNPPGFCSLGDSAPEQWLWNRTQEALRGTSELVHAAMRCDELRRFRLGLQDVFSEWLQVQVPTPRGKPEILNIDRESFLAGVSKETIRIDEDKINAALRRMTGDPGTRASNSAFVPLGRDGNAFYALMRSRMDTPGEVGYDVFGYSALTLVNSVALSINFYRSNSPDVQSLKSRTATMLADLLVAN